MNITREIIDDFFQQNIQRGIDLARDMLWGYFFVDERSDVLEAAASKLEEAGYRYVDLFAAASDDPDDRHMFLHVERVEKHSAKTLYRRCQELATFATRNGIETFDGFDVGNVDGSVMGPTNQQ